MGAGASIDVKQAVNTASADELNAAITALPPDLKEKLKAAVLLESPTSEFRKGQDVECRNEGEDWRPGKVVTIAPKLLIRQKDNWLPYQYAEVRALETEKQAPTADVQLDTKTAIYAKPASAKFVAANPGKLDEFYDLNKRKIGEGSYGSVMKAKNKATGAEVAVKSISKAHIKNMDRLKNETEIQTCLDHPNIGKLYESFEDARNLYLVLELLTGGELFDRIIDLGHFTERQAALVMKQAFQSLLYMNGQGICFRDFKPENLMFLDTSPIETSSVKLIDFGLACRCAADQVLTTKAGTPYYVAPQVLAGKYDMACDMWSLGVILYVLLCGYPPFYGDTDAEVLAKVRLGNYSFNAADWKGIGDEVKQLVRQCLKLNPKDRCTPEQALKHQWFNVLPKIEGSESVAVDTQFLDRFRQFRSATKFQKLVRQAIATRADDSQIKKLKEAFLALDTDGNGTLTLDELKGAIEKAGFQDMPSDLIGLMDAIGAEGLNRLDYTEFLAATLDEKVYKAEDQLWSAFRLFDKNGDGKIDLEEIRKMLGGDSDELSKEASTVAQAMIAEADKNGDSAIDFGEFTAMMRANGESSASV